MDLLARATSLVFRVKRLVSTKKLRENTQGHWELAIGFIQSQRCTLMIKEIQVDVDSLQPANCLT